MSILMIHRKSVVFSGLRAAVIWLRVDNLVCVFSAQSVISLTGVTPERMFNDHVAAVKAIAWCPWKPNLLSSGGGSMDHHLRFWNVYTGTLVKAVDVEQQVSLYDPTIN